MNSLGDLNFNKKGLLNARSNSKLKKSPSLKVSFFSLYIIKLLNITNWSRTQVFLPDEVFSRIQ